MRKLAGRAAIVTGGAQGIGRAITEELAAEGALVTFLDINSSTGSAAEREMGGIDAGIRFLQADVTREDQLRAAMEAVTGRCGRLDILINNAGRNTYFDATAMSGEDWDAALALNLKSAWLCAKYALPAMISQSAGVIVNISSLHARMTATGMFPYAAAKAGMVGLTRSLALDYGPAGVRVNAILPGWTRTPAVEAWLAMQPDPASALERVISLHPIRRIAAARDVARVAVFLASDDAAAITGAEIVVDCGLSARYAG